MMEYAHQYQQQGQNGHVQNIQGQHQSPPNPAQDPSMYQPQYMSQGSMQGGMQYVQAAAMAATAAASGATYPYMQSDGTLQSSPRLGSKKETRNPRSPPLGNMAAPDRRLSQVTSPSVTNAIMNHNVSRGGVPPSSIPQQQLHGPQSPELAAAPVEESPLYVNAKQFHRILKRRVARQRLEEALRLTSKGRKPYLHESRHNHAMRRPRGPGGRFLTADEVMELERAEQARNNLDGDVKHDNDAAEAAEPVKASSSKKRKSEGSSAQTNKKLKPSGPAADGGDAEDDA